MAEWENMEFVSPHKCIKNTATNGMILTCRRLAEDLGHLNGQTRSPQEGQDRREREKEDRKQDRKHTPGEGEELKEKRKSRTWGSPLTSREISRGRKGALGLAAVCSNWSVAGRTE